VKAVQGAVARSGEVLLLVIDPREEGWRDGSGDEHDCGITAAGESELLMTTELAPFASI
jgi:hypothetical protein